jgi:hypothetical protein
MSEAWSQLECEAVVRDYFEMFRKDVVGEPYSKTEHRRALQQLLDNRSEGSIEYKHQNISAILLETGYPYIPGYKPAGNYQSLLGVVVLNYLKGRADEILGLVARLSNSVPASVADYDWRDVVDAAPECVRSTVEEQIRERAPVKFNYAERESRNRNLGERGEEFVLRYERHRLEQAGRSDLANEIEWTAKVKGDGAGYDIRSFDEGRDAERYIEVKTTNSGKYQPFLITRNEVLFSASQAESYVLYRVFNFRSHPRLFLLPGNSQQHVNLSPRQYRASF